jgi:hypothetical protein
MKSARHCLKHVERWYWLIGPLALLWVILRSGTNPKRFTYPCQRAAMPLACNWLLAIIAFFSGSLFARRFAKFSTLVILVSGIVWLVATVPDFGQTEVKEMPPLPVWEVTEPTSRVFVMDSLPPTTGSLAAADESVPDEHLADPAIDTLVAMLEEGDVFLHQTASRPEGIVGSDNVVIIKGNFQWTSRNTTSTDRIKGLIWQILNHPDGFSGEILVCDNTQDLGTGINHGDNNSEDPDQSILDVVNTFFAKGYPVYLLNWVYIWNDVASEYAEGDYEDGYVYENETMVSYPKFLSPSGNHFISLRHGIWDSLTSEYDSSRLCIIDFPVLKAHFRGGSTVAVKNWIGVLTTAYREERYGGIDPLHDDLFFGPYALVARVMAVTFPKLTIVDAAWTTRQGPINLTQVENTNMLVASTDPVAASWYAAKFILTPIAVNPIETDPDRTGGLYSSILNRWTTFLADSAGYPCTNEAENISVCDRTILGNPYILSSDYVVDDNQGNNNGRADAGETVDLVVMLTNINLHATGVLATLTSEDQDIQIIDGTVLFGDIGKNDSATNTDNPFSFTVNTGTITHQCQFHLNITAEDGYEKGTNFELLVGTPNVLLVDDDAGEDFDIQYTTGMNLKQIYPETWDVIHKGTPSVDELNSYEMVLWFTGNDRNTTLNPNEQTVISSFLDAGGRLLLSGQNIGFDLVEGGTPEDADFYTRYLHTEYISDSIQEGFIQGMSGDPISGEFFFLPIGATQTSPDVIAPGEGSITIFQYQLSRESCAIRYEGDYRLVYFALGIEGIQALAGDDNVVRGTIIENSIQWLTYSPSPGDVTQDGVVNVLDVLATVNIILGVISPTRSQEWAADCNCDNMVNVLDVVGIVNVILGIDTCSQSGAAKITRETVAYLRKLKPYLSETQFKHLMTMINEVYAPTDYYLSQNHPNPFNPTTEIRYQIADSGIPFHTTLSVYNILGQEVKILVDEVKEPGFYTITWDGKDESGLEVASGVYFYRLTTGEYSSTKRMVLMK